MPEKKNDFLLYFCLDFCQPRSFAYKTYLALSHTYCRHDVTMVTANKDEIFLADHWFSFFRTTARPLINYIGSHDNLPHAKFSSIKHLF